MAKSQKPRKATGAPNSDQSLDLGRFTASRPADAMSPDDMLVPLVEDDTGHRFLVYATEQGMRVDLRYHGDTFWASQGQMAAMFGVTPQNITIHLRNIFGDGELVEGAVCKKSLHTGRDGKRYPTKLYDLNGVISVGYRISSKQGTLFRIWATDKLFQILTKGFYIDRAHLKSPDAMDALTEFREIARDIRASIANSYREVLNLCKLCADYDSSSESAREFFMGMENKLLWAAAQKTAPELIVERCDASKTDLGLTYFSGRRGPTTRDVVIGNNYLADGEAKTKNRITVMWLDYIEEQLDQGRLPTMDAVREKLEGFIKFNQWPMLEGRGMVTRTQADAHALAELKRYKSLEH
jgi:hypothetical protein